jgi:hypothetical protein
MYVMGMYLKNKKTSINYHSIVTRTVVTVNPSYKTIPSSMEKWPYKRCEERGGERGDNLVVFYYLSASFGLSDKRGEKLLYRYIIEFITQL